MNETPDLQLVHEHQGATGGFYLRDSDGSTLGEMEYRNANGETVEINHTWVDGSLRGQGRAGQLLAAAIDWVKSENLKVFPTCPYVAKKFSEDPELQALAA